MEKNVIVGNPSDLQTLKDQVKLMEAKMREIKEQEKALKAAKKAAIEKERAEREEKEKALFSDPSTEVVINLRFTNPAKFQGSKYRTVEDPALIEQVLNYFLNA